MNKKRKVGFQASLLLLTVLGLASCKGIGGGKLDTHGRAKGFTFCYYDSAFGSSWVDAVVKDYMENVNKDVWIEPKKQNDNVNTQTKIQSGVRTYDLYQIEVDMFNQSQYLEPLDSLMDIDLSTITANFPEADRESNVKVRDKIGEDQVKFYTEGDHIYQMNQTAGSGWNWAYNEDTLKKAFGDDYQIPRTSDEFFKMGDELEKKGVFLTAFAGDDTKGGEYTRYAYKTWFAQRMGLTDYNHYYSGEVKQSDGSYKRDDKKPQMVLDNADAIKDTYETVQKLCLKQNSYMHKNSDAFTYKDVDYALYGGKFKGSDSPSIAFHFVGAWLENEVQPAIDMGILKPGQNVRAMKTPVISSIIDRLSTINDDATLSAAVKAVDENKTYENRGEALTAVSEEDYQSVKEARNLTPELNCREFVIPKTADNKPEVKEFLAYLTTNRAQRIAAKSCQGINTLPYGYNPTEEDMGFTLSQYKKDYQNIRNTCLSLDVEMLSNRFARFMNIPWCTSCNSLSIDFFTNETNHRATDPSKIVESTYQSLQSAWETKVNQYKINYPEA